MEKDIERWLRWQITNLGGLFFKHVSPGNSGVPDRIAVLPGGRVYFIELKDVSGKVGRLQRWQVDRIRQRGANACIIQGMDQAREFIKDVRGGDAR